jgi:DNA uptake protein ComE-like DNA-binding protein
VKPYTIKAIAAGLAGEFLTYNRVEQRGILVLCLLLLALILFNAVIPAETFQQPVDFREFSKEVREFEKAWQKAADSDSMARAEKYSRQSYGAASCQRDSGNNFLKMQRPLLMIDLNTADTLDLQQLRGIGPGFARRIVAYRERLRGYSDKRQVLEVFGMDSARYHAIAGYLTTTRDSVHPMNLNTVTIKELMRHPYFPFALAKNIVVYRQKIKAFQSLDELNKVPGISDSLFHRMVVYLRLGP